MGKRGGNVGGMRMCKGRFARTGTQTRKMAAEIVRDCERLREFNVGYEKDDAVGVDCLCLRTGLSGQRTGRASRSSWSSLLNPFAF